MATPRGRRDKARTRTTTHVGPGTRFTVVARRPLTLRNAPTLQQSGGTKKVSPGDVVTAKKTMERVVNGRTHTFVEIKGGWLFTPSKSGTKLLAPKAAAAAVLVPASGPAEPPRKGADAASGAVASRQAPQRTRPIGLTAAAMAMAYAEGHLVYKCTAPRPVAIRCKPEFDLLMDTGLVIAPEEFVLVTSTEEPKEAPAYTPDGGHGRGRGRRGRRGRGRGRGHGRRGRGRGKHGKKDEAVEPEGPIRVTFICLADGRGWLLNKDPSSGVEWMAEVAEDPELKRAREDSILKEAVIAEGKQVWKEESAQELLKLESSLRGEQIALEQTLEQRVTEETVLLQRAAEQLKALQAQLAADKQTAAAELEQVRNLRARERAREAKLSTWHSYTRSPPHLHPTYSTQARVEWDLSARVTMEEKLAEQKLALEVQWAATKGKWEGVLHQLVADADVDERTRTQMLEVIAMNGMSGGSGGMDSFSLGVTSRPSAANAAAFAALEQPLPSAPSPAQPLRVEALLTRSAHAGGGGGSLGDTSLGVSPVSRGEFGISPTNVSGGDFAVSPSVASISTAEFAVSPGGVSAMESSLSSLAGDDESTFDDTDLLDDLEADEGGDLEGDSGAGENGDLGFDYGNEDDDSDGY